MPWLLMTSRGEMEGQEDVRPLQAVGSRERAMERSQTGSYCAGDGGIDSIDAWLADFHRMESVKRSGSGFNPGIISGNSYTNSCRGGYFEGTGRDALSVLGAGQGPIGKGIGGGSMGGGWPLGRVAAETVGVAVPAALMILRLGRLLMGSADLGPVPDVRTAPHALFRRREGRSIVAPGLKAGEGDIDRQKDLRIALDDLCSAIVEAPVMGMRALLEEREWVDECPSGCAAVSRSGSGSTGGNEGRKGGEELAVATLVAAVAASEALTHRASSAAAGGADGGSSSGPARGCILPRRPLPGVQRLATKVISAVSAAPLMAQEARADVLGGSAVACGEGGGGGGAMGGGSRVNGVPGELPQRRAVIRLRHLHPDSMAALARTIATLRPRATAQK